MKKITKNKPDAQPKTAGTKQPPPTEPTTLDPRPQTQDSPSPTSGQSSPRQSEATAEEPDQPSRKGHVARLPKDVRDKVNFMILDGHTYKEIIASLGVHAKCINEDNLTNWRSGGYQDWLKEQQRVQDCRISQELTLDLAREREGIESFQAPNKIASALICEALADVGAGTFRKALGDPQTCLRLLNTLSRITAAGMKCERHLADEADRKAKIKQHQTAKKGGGHSVSRKRIEQEFHLFPKNPNLSEPIRTQPNLSEPKH